MNKRPLRRPSHAAPPTAASPVGTPAPSPTLPPSPPLAWTAGEAEADTLLLPCARLGMTYFFCASSHAPVTDATAGSRISAWSGMPIGRLWRVLRVDELRIAADVAAATAGESSARGVIVPLAA